MSPGLFMVARTRTVNRTQHRPSRAASAFAILGFAAIVTGGLISAIFASSPTQQQSWTVAYLVLVVGVAQIGLGAGQAWLATHPPRTAVLATQFIVFNLGHSGVIVGTITDAPTLVSVGGSAIMFALLLFLWSVRSKSRWGWLRYLYLLLVVILIVSVPIGLILAHLRHA